MFWPVFVCSSVSRITQNVWVDFFMNLGNRQIMYHRRTDLILEG